MIGANIFYHFFYRPILNILVYLTSILPKGDCGIAIIILTVLVRILLFPLFKKSLREQKALQELQPKLKEIQEKYKEDKEKFVQESLKIFQEKKINPFLGIFLTIIQLPFLIGVFLAIKSLSLGKEVFSKDLYFFLNKNPKISFSFLGLIDLSKPFLNKIGNKTFFYWPTFPLILLTFFVNLFQFQFTSLQNSPKQTKIFQQIFNPFLFVMFLYILINLPAGVSLYLLVSSLIGILQERSIFSLPKNERGRN